MIRIAALNEAVSDDDDVNCPPEVATKEAQEEEAFKLYNEALALQNQGDNDGAEELLKQLLSTSLIAQIAPSEHSNPLKQPGGLLKYSTHKNLAIILSMRNDYHSAMESYLEAVALDSTDVLLWFRIGVTALNIHNFPLARLSFQEGLKCNSNHWPCLDNLVTVLYALNDYATCLYYIAQAFERDMGYVKGYAIRDKIYEEQPSLRWDSFDLFKDCDDSVFNMEYDKEEAEKYVQESLEMRKIKSELGRFPSPPVLSFTKSWTQYTWKHLGKSLISLYDHIYRSDPHISFGCRINLAQYLESEQKVDAAGKSDGAAVDSEIGPAGSVVAADPTTAAGSYVPKTDVNPPVQANSDVPPIVPQQSLTTAADKSSLLLHDYACMDIYAENGPAMDVDEAGESGVGGESSWIHRGTKRKRASSFDYSDFSAKRRSARVRGTMSSVKKQDNVNFLELLKKFLPSSLLRSKSKDDDKETSSSSSSVDDKLIVQVDNMELPNAGNKSEAELAIDEEEEVKDFLRAYNENSGVLDLLRKFLVIVVEGDNIIWPQGTTDIFLSAFSKLRGHITQPNLFCQELDNETIKDSGMVTLVYCELKMDKWHLSKIRPPVMSPPGTCRTHVAGSKNDGVSAFPGKYFLEDLEFLVRLTTRKDVFDNDWSTFFIRVMWLKARFSMLQGQMDFAVDSFDRITSYFIDDNNEDFTIELKNCQVDNVVTKAHVQKQLESLRRCQSLEEVHRLYEMGEYAQVIDLLIPTFNQPHSKEKVDSNKSIPERHAQLQLLQDSLWKRGDCQQCLYWGEESFNETLQQFLTTATKSSKEDWATAMTEILSGLERVISKDAIILKTLDHNKRVRLANNLIQCISIQNELPESVVCDMNLNSAYPWTVFCRVIEYEEERLRCLFQQVAKDKSRIDGDSRKVEFGPGVPSSRMLLYTAHEFLGRQSWCCNSEGTLLLLLVDVLLKELNRYPEDQSNMYREDLETNLEQCFYCLYGHPQKRTRAKHLMEHSSSQIPLTWERAIPVFEYFKPKQAPEFNSHKAGTVSAELENLLRRITLLIPPQQDPANTVDTVTAYIEGGCDVPPFVPEDKPIKLPIVKELYYLLADYYFKNKEFGKAIKFYILDICVNPNRLDSWAGMALSRSSQLEQKLNSSELKNDGPIYRKSTPALRSFHRALEIDETNTTLWIEYGSLTYTLHSYFSRQLKQHRDEEICAMLRIKRDEMLEKASKCFRSANKHGLGGVEDEEWLHHYMLGKVTEKKIKSIGVTLEHYRLAAFHLHENEARYPRKIQYHNPPRLSLEALEVFYRTHGAILKYLLMYEGTPLPGDTRSVLEKYLKAAAEGPFAKFQEKRSTSLCPSDVEEAAMATLPPPGEQTPHSQPGIGLRSVSYDHDYFRRKRKDSSTEESEPELHQLRQSADSSSESMDSATVKDILNSIVSVVSERFTNVGNRRDKTTLVVLGDTKIIKPEPIRSSGPKIKSENKGTSANSLVKSTRVDEAGEDKKQVDVAAKERNGKKTPEDASNEKTEAEVSSEEKETIEGQATSEAELNDHMDLVDMCFKALKLCLQRFPQHYKALFRLAHYCCYSKMHRNLKWSRDYLLGPCTPWQHLQHMPSQGLFSERKNTNFFNGIWRIPNDEIDRPGSFGSHMYRSIVLLVEVLLLLKDYNILVHLIGQLNRNPDTGKKFLRDVDRLYLVGQILQLTLLSLRVEMNAVCDAEPSNPEIPDHSAAVKQLLLIYRIWNVLTKIIDAPLIVNQVLEEAYITFKNDTVDKTTPVLDQAIKFCQQQNLLIKQTTSPSGMDVAKLPGSEGSAKDSDFVYSLEYFMYRKDPPKTAKQAALDMAVKDANLTSTYRGKSVWTSNTIPSSGVVIGSMTITPVTHIPEPTQAEGLLQRLAGSIPKSPLNTAISDALQKKHGAEVNSGSHLTSFDPSRLTADVQSKITSLDPLEHQPRSTVMSGYQMEFMRQINNRRIVTRGRGRPRGRPTLASKRGWTPGRASHSPGHQRQFGSNSSPSHTKAKDSDVPTATSSAPATPPGAVKAPRNLTSLKTIHNVVEITTGATPVKVSPTSALNPSDLDTAKQLSQASADQLSSTAVVKLQKMNFHPDYMDKAFPIVSSSKSSTPVSSLATTLATTAAVITPTTTIAATKPALASNSSSSSIKEKLLAYRLPFFKATSKDPAPNLTKPSSATKDSFPQHEKSSKDPPKSIQPSAMCKEDGQTKAKEPSAQQDLAAGSSKTTDKGLAKTSSMTAVADLSSESPLMTVGQSPSADLSRDESSNSSNTPSSKSVLRSIRIVTQAPAKRAIPVVTATDGNTSAVIISSDDKGPPPIEWPVQVIVNASEEEDVTKFLLP